MAHRPAGISFFARISSLELACPDCDTVHICRTNHRRSYDPFTSTFRCRRCSAIFVLGVLAYRTTRYLGGTAAAPPPADRIPTLRQSAQLRAGFDLEQRALAQAAPWPPVPLPEPEPPPPPPAPAKIPKLRKPGDGEPKPTRQFFRKARAGKALDSGGGLRLPADQKHRHGQAVNLIIDGVCRCQVGEGDMSPVVAPDCPMHSVKALSGR